MVFSKQIEQAKSSEEAITGTISPHLKKGITFKDITFIYKKNEILKNVSLTIPYGKFIVITGLSGVGKTTLADLLTGIIRPYSGDLKIDDVSLSHIDLFEWRQMIGYVPQDFFLFHESIYSNVTLNDPTLTDQDVEDARDPEEAQLRLRGQAGVGGPRLGGPDRGHLDAVRAARRRELRGRLHRREGHHLPF